MAQIFTTEQVGKTRALTPEGFLLCRDVPLTKVGTMDYEPGELSDTINSKVALTRDAIDLSARDAVASFEGKPVTIGHPADDITPANWGALSVGVITNARFEAGAIVADLLITRSDAIQILDSDEMREVSTGCSGEIDISGGAAYLRDIRCNHVAIVPAGRQGAACSIGDSTGYNQSSLTGSEAMTDKTAVVTDADDAPDTGDSEKISVGAIGGLLSKLLSAISGGQQAVAAPPAPAAEPIAKPEPKDDDEASTSDDDGDDDDGDDDDDDDDDEVTVGDTAVASKPKQSARDAKRAQALQTAIRDSLGTGASSGKIASINDANAKFWGSK